MILGVLSDTHQNCAGPWLARILEGALGPAQVLLHAGDYTAEGVLDHLEFVDPRPFYGVAGNMDAGWGHERLPTKRVLDLGGLRIGLIHGWGAPVGLLERVRGEFPEDLDLLVFGHAHQPEAVRRGRTLIVNPGSAWHNRAPPAGTVALVDVGGGSPVEARFVEVLS
jgi:putative phosphoesterase